MAVRSVSGKAGERIVLVDETQANRQTIEAYELITRKLRVPRVPLLFRALAGEKALLPCWQALRPAVISKLYRDLAEHGGQDGQPLAATTVSHIHRTLCKALADAVQVEQILAINPAARSKRPRSHAAEPTQVWTAEQLHAFLTAARVGSAPCSGVRPDQAVPQGKFLRGRSVARQHNKRLKLTPRVGD